MMLACGVWCVACGGGPADASSVTAINVAPPVVELRPFDTLHVRAVGESDGHDVVVTAQWISSDSSVAVVNGDGRVTARGPGIARITATTGKLSGQSVVTVLPSIAVAAVILAGQGQIGLAGHALADSLAIRVTDASGNPAVGDTVRWSATGATISPLVSVTNSAGVTTAQMRPAASGQVSAVASVATSQGSARLAFNSGARDPVACNLTSPLTPPVLTEGPTTGALRPAVGSVKGILLFVAFSDAPPAGRPQDLGNQYVPGAAGWFAASSYGRFSFEVTSVNRWFQLPGSVTDYVVGGSGGSLNTLKYLADAVHLADPDVDFSPYTHIYVMLPPEAGYHREGALISYPGGIVTDDNSELRFGSGLSAPGTSTLVPYAMMAHETLHTLGLPDVYSLAGTTRETISGAVGGWDLMGWLASVEDIVAWHKLKLGWIDQDQFLCTDLAHRVGLEEVLSPLSIAGGRKAVGIKVDSSTMLVAEIRDNNGLDATVGLPGMLVYQVNAAAPSGTNPIVVQAAGRASLTSGPANVPPLSEATFSLGSGRVSRLAGPFGMTFEVVAIEGKNYRIRVKPTLSQ